MKEQVVTRIDGIGVLHAGEYGDIRADGVIQVDGDVRFANCRIDGIGKSKGAMEGNCLCVDGSFKTAKGIKVKALEINGLMRCDEVKVYADEIHVEGLLSCKDEISADVIRVDGLIKVPMLSGDDIELNYMKSKLSGLVLLPFKAFSFNVSMQGVDRIECTKLKASNLVSKHICAQQLHLLDHCQIDVVECDGDIYMDTTCTIKELIGEYRLHRI